jgi:epoxyqueuosine reductase QueG
MNTIDRLDRNTVGHILAGTGIDAWGVAANMPHLDEAPSLPRAISLIVRFAPASLLGVQTGPTGAYLQEYLRLNDALDTAAAALVEQLRRHGHAAERVPATSDHGRPDFAHEIIATLAGLGWIGKTGLFVSPDFGPAVRLATVFTDLPLTPGTPVTTGHCGNCRLCVDHCPAGSGRDITWQAGMTRDDMFDAAACQRFRSGLSEFGELCGICVAVCPYSQQDSSPDPSDSDRTTSFSSSRE